MNDPRLTYRALAASALALITFVIQWLAPGIPEQFWPLFSGFYMAAWGAGEVWYDSRRKAG